jgi:hypothetical protein
VSVIQTIENFGFASVVATLGWANAEITKMRVSAIAVMAKMRWATCFLTCFILLTVLWLR